MNVIVDKSTEEGKGGVKKKKKRKVIRLLDFSTNDKYI